MKGFIASGLITLISAVPCLALSADFSGGTSFPAEMGHTGLSKSSYFTRVNVLQARTPSEIESTTPIENPPIPTSLKKWTSTLCDLFEERADDLLINHIGHPRFAP